MTVNMHDVDDNDETEQFLREAGWGKGSASSVTKKTTISAPGIYNLGFEDVVFDGLSISSQTLQHWEQWGAAKSKARMDRLWRPEDTPENAFGRAVHLRLLQPEKFAQAYAVSSYKDFRTKAAKEERERIEAAGKTVVKASWLESVERIVELVAKHDLASGLLRASTKEELIVSRNPGGWWNKGWTDMRVEGHRVLADLKTSSDVSPEAFARGLGSGWFQQLAFYADILKALGKRVDHVFIVGVSTVAPFIPASVAVYEVDEESLDWGRALNTRVERELRWCIENNRWPAWQEGKQARLLSLPDWQRRRLIERREMGEI